MKIAIISDIHSNCFALEAVLNEFKNHDITNIIILGDIFGYYPWAVKTFDLLKPFLSKAYCIKGNHDELLLNVEEPDPSPSYWYAAKQNEAELEKNAPDAIKWLKSLDFCKKIDIDKISVRMYHGTPDNPEMGRYYPDDVKAYDWGFKQDEIILLGHTHYPINKVIEGSTIFNPGSVGQSRDGDPMPSWGIFDVKKRSFKFVRTIYDNLAVMEKLYKMDWDKKAILSLNKKAINF